MEKRIIIYTVIIIICIICLGVGVYVQFFYKYSEQDVFLTGKIDDEIVSEEMYQNLKNNFDSIFTNTFIETDYTNELPKKEYDKNTVYTKQMLQKKEQGKYDININIPFFNLTLDGIDEINNEISSIFEKKAKDIIENSNQYTVYNINYATFLNKNIISIVIKATLKEGQNSQRVIVKTYNYDVEKETLIPLVELINIKKLKLDTVQKKIRNEIEKINNENTALEKLGYAVYKRDMNSSIYDISNTDIYFLGTNNYLYVLYPYGNNNYTNEIDIIIF